MDLIVKCEKREAMPVGTLIGGGVLGFGRAGLGASLSAWGLAYTSWLEGRQHRCEWERGRWCVLDCHKTPRGENPEET